MKNVEENLKLIDLHLHPGWTDFDPEVQKKRTKEKVRNRIRTFLQEYKKHGIVLIRDAGGYLPEREQTTQGMKNDLLLSEIIPNCGMLYSENRDIKDVLKRSYPWVKLFAAGGIGSERDKVLDPLISENVFSETVRRIHACKKKVMVHTWGGVSLDWCIRYHADSVEHGVYLTEEQAGAMADTGIPLIPTTCIYRLLAEKPELFHVSPLFSERAAFAAEAQLRTVKLALSQGVKIGYGTDFYSDPALAEYGGYELTTLCDCGLSRRQAVLAGTVNAAEILGL